MTSWRVVEARAIMPSPEFPRRKQVVALTHRATVYQPQRFVHSEAVRAHVGLTPKRDQSGEIDLMARSPNLAKPCWRTTLYELGSCC